MFLQVVLQTPYCDLIVSSWSYTLWLLINALLLLGLIYPMKLTCCVSTFIALLLIIWLLPNRFFAMFVEVIFMEFCSSLIQCTSQLSPMPIGSTILLIASLLWALLFSWATTHSLGLQRNSSRCLALPLR